MRRSTTAFVVVVVAIVIATSAYLAVALGNRDNGKKDQSLPPVVTSPTKLPGDTVFVRDTRDGETYGRVGLVSQGERTTTERHCDRIDVTSSLEMSCLEAVPGVTLRSRLSLIAPDGRVERDWSFAGIPSRTRLSPSGGHWAATTFVTGHSYSSARFSTLTLIGRTDGGKPVSLEDFDLTLEGKRVSPVDRNFWGVTFAKDDRTFYATVLTKEKTWLVQGDLETRTLRSIHADVECPALSPDETRIAFKRRDALPDATWTLAVLDLATGQETLLDQEGASVDDQAMWLDDTTLLYGLPVDDQPGTSDVWAIAADNSHAPERYLEGASSPAVPRG